MYGKYVTNDLSVDDDNLSNTIRLYYIAVLKKMLHNIILNFILKFFQLYLFFWNNELGTLTVTKSTLKLKSHIKKRLKNYSQKNSSDDRVRLTGLLSYTSYFEFRYIDKLKSIQMILYCLQNKKKTARLMYVFRGGKCTLLPGVANFIVDLGSGKFVLTYYYCVLIVSKYK